MFEITNYSVVYDLILASAAIAGALMTIKKFWSNIRPFVKRIFPIFFRYESMNDDLKNLTKLTAEIKEQLTNNGGKSLKDALDRIEISQIKTDERTKAILSTANEAILETDYNGDCVFVNRAYIALVKRDMNQLRGKGWINTVHKDDRERVSEGWYQAIMEKREYEDTYRKQTPDGEEFFVEVKTVKMQDYFGNPIGYLKFVKVKE